MMTKLEEIALAIFDKVTSGGGQTRWGDLSDEERQDALEWALAAMLAARERSAELVIACAELLGSQTEIWETSIDALLGRRVSDKSVHRLGHTAGEWLAAERLAPVSDIEHRLGDLPKMILSE